MKMYMEKKAIILFTRLPVAGMVKTRLMPYLSGTACANLQWALLKDLVPILHSVEWDLFIFYALPSQEQSLLLLQELMDPAFYLPQQGNDLGHRMNMAFAKVFQKGYDSCLLLGSDIPFIKSEDITVAWHVLSRHDVVFGPSEDGGYWLVGLKKPFPPLFQWQNYSHNNVLAQAKKVCSTNKLSVGLAATKRDIDTWDDLHYYWQNAQLEKSPCLSRFMQNLFRFNQF